jgi:hypothetical protein
MLHGSPTRPAHRAGPVGLNLLVRPTVAPSTGQHRQPDTRSLRQPWATPNRLPRVPQFTGRRALREPERAPQRLMSGLAGLIVLSICGLVTFFIVADRGPVHADQSGGPAVPWAISARSIDPEPLSLDEIFPGAEIRPVPGAEPYRVTMTHIDTDCHLATTGSLGLLLDDHGCSQVVRAAMTAPHGGHHVTAGIFNLADETGAAQVSSEVRTLVETGGGSFAAMAAGAMPGAAPQSVPDSQVGWQARGHYLAYCVIARADGKPVPDADLDAERITVELLETYLSGEKIGARAGATT